MSGVRTVVQNSWKRCWSLSALPSLDAISNQSLTKERGTSISPDAREIRRSISRVAGDHWTRTFRYESQIFRLNGHTRWYKKQGWIEDWWYLWWYISNSKSLWCYIIMVYYYNSAPVLTNKKGLWPLCDINVTQCHSLFRVRPLPLWKQS